MRAAHRPFSLRDTPANGASWSAGSGGSGARCTPRPWPTAPRCALGATRFAGITYFTEDVNRAFEAYFRDAGFTCLGLHAIGVPFARMHELPVEDIDAFARATLQAHPSAQALYLLGAWRAHDILETLERDCGVPAVLSIVANGWAVRKHFQIDERLAGYGQLLRLA